MPLLEVLNVGQGDSIIIRPKDDCNYASHCIIVDLGPGQYDITKHIQPGESIHIIVTHHDADHFNGIRFFADKMDRVEDIYVPLYQNEITIIANSLLHLKGIRETENCDDFIRTLEDVVANQLFLREITGPNHRGPKLRYAFENRRMCNHLSFFNPPARMNVYDWITEADCDDLCQLFEMYFEKDYFGYLIEYLFHSGVSRPHIKHKTQENNLSPITQLLLDDTENIKREYDWDGRRGRAIVVEFFMNNREEIDAFIHRPSRERMKLLYDAFIRCTHDACIVLKAEYDDGYLLTGDASKKVFNRLIASKALIQAEYLKVPHHGSKENMDGDILDYINPRVAIISHDNRRFGRAKDSHPNQEILNLLQEREISILISNDVIKNGITIMKKRKHSSDENVKVY